MNVRLVQTISDRIGDATGLRSLLVNSRASGSAIPLRSQAGVQYDRSQWRFGATIRTPGLTFIRSGGVTLDGLIDVGAMSAGASVFDPDADLEYHLPWEFQGGAAWVRDRLELELDVQAYSPIDGYSMLATGQPVVIYSETGGSRPDSTINRARRTTSRSGTCCTARWCNRRWTSP